ncbi:right-handed parallel beta-helix repeat-containing protein [Thermospira aquatica]|uniref:DUF1565 domain-containing protein n=1 Tax=Thermospira aquatica TaxID=2828656 RepID=A0AAX3BB91_9SPIR|nr:hypothetical protein [Thermospira aquatica]URA09488.1 hypothetical protein KDW03_08300 [Thermospira aquatica]
MFGVQVHGARTNESNTSAPASTNFTTAYDELLFQGTASVGATYSITAVKFRTNGGEWENASGTTTWSFTAVLPLLTNLVDVIAIASSGKTNMISVKAVRDIAIFVSKGGDDANDGISANKSVKTIQVGISRAVQYNIPRVKVASGVYEPGDGLESSEAGVYITNISGFILEGGYDPDFTMTNMATSLDGKDTLKHVMVVSNARNILVNNFVVRNGKANGSGIHACGGGLLLYETTNTILTNMIISNNKANFNGGGVYVASSHTNVILGDLYANSATNVGGGMGNISSNGLGGGVYLTISLSNRIGGEIFSNEAGSGGGIYFNSSPTNTLSADVHHNRAMSGAYGGGVYFKNSVIFFDNTTNRGNIGYGIYTNNSVFENFDGVIWGTGSDANTPDNVGP